MVNWLKTHLLTIAITALLITGAGVMLYPTVAELWNGRLQYRVVADYESAAARLPERDHAGYRREAEAYNDALYRRGSRAVLSEPGLVEGYEELLVIPGSSAMGYVAVPSIGVELPIYHGTGDVSLARGAGHLKGSSLPVGGVNTHCVISAHSGMPSARMFTDISRLAEGDRFEIHALGDTLAYEIDRITVVLPTELDELYIKTGEDLCTLMTCTPYGVNTHRLLVRGRRVPYEAADPDDAARDEEAPGIDRRLIAAAAAAAGIAAVIILSQIMVSISRKRGGR